MFVQVDIDTGRFHNGKIITENSILPCSHHPDTGELIEGILPNWDIVKPVSYTHLDVYKRQGLRR